MTFFEQYIAYFKHQAASHPDIQHADAEGRRAFALLKQEAATGDFRSTKTEKGFLLHLIDPNGTARGDGDPLIGVTGGFLIARYHNSRNEGDPEIEAAMSESWRIGTEIMVKMVKDSEAGHPFFRYSANSFALLNFSFMPRRHVGDILYSGWLFTFRLAQPVDICTAGVAPTVAWLDGGLTPRLT